MKSIHEWELENLVEFFNAEDASKPKNFNIDRLLGGSASGSFLGNKTHKVDVRILNKIKQILPMVAKSYSDKNELLYQLILASVAALKEKGPTTLVTNKDVSR